MGCLRALVQGGVRVDEDTVMMAYNVSLDILHEQEENGTEQDEDGGEGRDFLGGRRGEMVVNTVVEALREGGVKR